MWEDAVRTAKVAIPALCVLVLGVVVAHGVQVTASERSPSSVSLWRGLTSQEECLYHEVRSRLPDRAAVYIPNSSTTFDGQRMLELSTLWVVPQPSPATADWTISIVPGSTCAGESLHVEPVVGPRFVTTVVFPVNGAALSGTVGLVATATAPVAVSRVDFVLTDAQRTSRIAVARLSLVGWIATWDTASVANGTYTLRSVAYETSGHSSESTGLTVTVEN